MLLETNELNLSSELNQNLTGTNTTLLEPLNFSSTSGGCGCGGTPTISDSLVAIYLAQNNSEISNNLGFNDSTTIFDLLTESFLSDPFGSVQGVNPEAVINEGFGTTEETAVLINDLLLSDENKVISKSEEGEQGNNIENEVLTSGNGEIGGIIAREDEEDENGGENIRIDPLLKERIDNTLSRVTGVVFDFVGDLVNPLSVPLPEAIGQCFASRTGASLITDVVAATLFCSAAGIPFPGSGENLDNDDNDIIEELDNLPVNPVAACLVALVRVGISLTAFIGCVIDKVNESGNDAALSDPRFQELIRLSRQINQINSETRQLLSQGEDED